jgi:aldose 1-epimerase
MIPSQFISMVDDELIPTGELRHVAKTPFDFRTSRPIRLIQSNGEPFHYDQNFMLDTRSGALRHAATVKSLKNNLSMQVFTSEPCIQFYDAKGLNVPVTGLGGQKLQAYAGFCLEPQNVPDSPNVPHFPDPVLRPGQMYRQITDYRFT